MLITNEYAKSFWLYKTFNSLIILPLINIVYKLISSNHPYIHTCIHIHIYIYIYIYIYIFMIILYNKWPHICPRHTAQFFGATIALVSLSCMLTVVVIHVHHRTAFGHSLPRWARFIFIDGYWRHVTGVMVSTELYCVIHNNIKILFFILKKFRYYYIYLNYI